MASILERLPPWRKAAPWVALALSLALNGFFIIGWWRHADGAGSWREISKVDLAPHQRDALRDLRRSHMADGKEFAARALPSTNRLWDELAKGAPDRATLDQAMGEIEAVGREGRVRRLERTMRFLDGLTPEQRAEFVALVRQRVDLTGLIPPRPSKRAPPPPPACAP